MNAEVDHLIDAGRTTVDQQQRKQIYAQVQKILADELPYINLWYFDNVVVHSAAGEESASECSWKLRLSYTGRAAELGKACRRVRAEFGHRVRDPSTCQIFTDSML